MRTRQPDDLARFESEGLLDQIHRTKIRLFGRLLEDSGASLRLGVGRLITEARSVGIRLAVCTTSQLETFEVLVVNALGIEAISWFRVAVTGSDVKRNKPDPEGYREVIRRLRMEPWEAVVIEDSGRGVEAARGAGIPVIAVPSQVTADDDFSEAMIVLSDLGEPGEPFNVIRGDPAGFSYVSVRAVRSWQERWRDEA